MLAQETAVSAGLNGDSKVTESLTTPCTYDHLWVGCRLDFATYDHLCSLIASHGDALENRYTSHFCHQRLGPMKEAPSFKGASLVSETPPSGTLGGGVLVTVGVCLEGEPRHVIRCHEREYFEYY